MTEKKPPQTADDVLRELHEFLLGEEPDFRSMPIEKVQEYLKEAGIDPSDTIRGVRKQITKAKGARALRTARERRQQRSLKMEERKDRAKDLMSMGRNELIALLKSIVGQEQATVYMRRYETADEEDLRSLIEDIEILGNEDDAED